MKKNIKTITSIKALEDSKPADGSAPRKRWSLRSGKTWFCVLVGDEGETTCPVAVNDKIVAVERTVTTESGETVTQFYFDQKIVSVEEYIKDEANSDVDFLVEQHKATAALRTQVLASKLKLTPEMAA